MGGSSDGLHGARERCQKGAEPHPDQVEGGGVRGRYNVSEEGAGGGGVLMAWEGRRERDIAWEGYRGRGIWRRRDVNGEGYGMGGM
jgi:hypothetical protein